MLIHHLLPHVEVHELLSMTLPSLQPAAESLSPIQTLLSLLHNEYSVRRLGARSLIHPKEVASPPWCMAGLWSSDGVGRDL